MKRDKIISIRVDSSLFEKFLSVVDSKTEKYTGRGGRNLYNYCDDSGASWEKFTPADLFEKAMRDYVEKYSSKP